MLALWLALDPAWGLELTLEQALDQATVANLELRQAPGEALAVDFVLASLTGALLASLFAYKFIRAKGVSLPSHKTSAGRACVGILIAGIVAFASLLVA